MVSHLKKTILRKLGLTLNSEISTSKVVPRAGLEPARTCVQRILSPLRLPISPPGHFQLNFGGGGRNRTGVHGFAGRCITTLPLRHLKCWSGKRVSNSRPQPWQGCALPTELFPHHSPNIQQIDLICYFLC